MECRVLALHEKGVFDDDSVSQAEAEDIAEGCERCVADAPTPSERFYKIPVSWTMVADVKVRAKSLKEAIKIVEDQQELPPNPMYLDDSFAVNTEVAEDNYQDG